MLEPLRLSGAVWGQLIGEAMGVPYEFSDPSRIGKVEWGAMGTHHQPPGTWSDDGGMMLALLDSLLPDERSAPPRSGGFDLQRQASNFLNWRRGAFTPDEAIFDIGGATLRALNRLERGTPPERSGEGEEGLGNGSLMRSVAIGLAGRKLGVAELVDQAERSSAITHGAALARVTCALYVLICQRLLGGEHRGESLAGAKVDLQALYREPGGKQKAQALEEVLAWPGRAGRGHVVDSFWSAWDAFAGAKDYAQTIERAIRYGHDTDTTACIAGGMAGIQWGIDSIPDEWLSGMRGKNVAQPIVDRLIETAGWTTAHKRPLRFDWVDPSGVPAAAGWTGKLGMTFLPGNKGEGNTGRRWRDTATDAMALAAAGASTFVLLVEDHELEMLRTVGLPASMAAAGVELIRYPIVDTHVPVDSGTFRELLSDVERRLRDGQNVVVACRGGQGRTGTVVACALIDAGLDAKRAVSLTRDTRHGTIENPDQKGFVRAWVGTPAHVEKASVPD